ncbi:MAG TPA: hypothetical protein VMK42_03175 [Anaeromyxobacteraceae bacterium]|nr:hypothetical protein [Anaeromyxobacteraceae bacterium]
MKHMSLEEAADAIRRMSPGERQHAMEALAAAVAEGVADGPSGGWTILDPQDCTPAMAERCDYRGGPGNGRICLTRVDAGVPCPHAEYVP